jgi:hypothetical protein
MTAVVDPPRTAYSILFGSDETASATIEQSLEHTSVGGSLEGALRSLAKAGRRALRREVAGAITRLLDHDVVNILAAGWRKHSALSEAAQRSLENPNITEVVELATHRITSVHRPSIDLILDGVRVATMTFELRLEFLVKGFVTTIRNGKIVFMDAGYCDVIGTLTAEHVQIVRGEGHYELPMVIPVDGLIIRPLPSLEAATAAPAPVSE